MSAKYEKLKKRDLLLPAPLRWLTRAFSSITLAVTLLVMVILYGTVASVPIAFLVRGLLYGIFSIGIPLALIAVGLLFLGGRFTKTPIALQARLLICCAFILIAAAISVMTFQMIAHHTFSYEWFKLNHATVIYRLPFFEMTELEFYSWWPMKLILGLFVINMIWATIRRIEFKFVNIGVLTVHTGIVILAAGSILYGNYKLEGDTILWREDLGGTPVNSFYDGTTPALYVQHEDKLAMFPLPQLPRYNDYDNVLNNDKPDLAIRLHEHPTFNEVFEGKFTATIDGFLAYAELQPTWVDSGQHGELQTAFRNPALKIGLGSENEVTSTSTRTLVAMLPSQRAIDEQGWAMEFLYNPSTARVAALLSDFDGPHGLVVEIPEKNYREVFAIAPGKTIKTGDTGYTLTIDDVGPYGMSFATPGYEGATDTRAMVQINDGETTYRRLVMHRYPERSQDFIPAPGDPSVGPMGRRVEPNDRIRLTYLDSSKPQLHLVTDQMDLKDISLIARLPGQKTISGVLHDTKFPFGYQGKQWIHIVERLTHAVRTLEPNVTPKAERKAKDEGTYVNAVMPVTFTAKKPDGSLWQRRIWLGHMRYPIPEYADPFHSPVDVNIPGLGKITVSFSRQRIPLNFAMTLKKFEMKPYPGSNIPRDFQSDILVTNPDGTTQMGITRLNNPLIYNGFKLSQTGWDPGNPRGRNNDAKNEQGAFINQQRFSIIGVGNNAGIRIIFVGCTLIVIGIPWAFYIKPLLVQRKKRQLQAEIARSKSGDAGNTQAADDKSASRDSELEGA